MNFYVYGYSDTLSSDPYFYIGKGIDDRYLHHFNLCLKQDSSFYTRLRSVLLQDYKRIVVSFLKSGMTEPEAFDFEIEQIEKYGRLDLGTGCLTNRTAGGDSPTGNSSWITEAQRVELSDRASKQFSDPKQRERARRIGIARAGRPVEAFNLLTGVTVLSFDSMHAVIKKGFDRNHVMKVLNGRRQQTGGYGWRYVE